MKNHVITISSLLLLLIASHTSAACDNLIGTWYFVSERDTKADGTLVKVDAPAQGYAGTLIYTADGHVSALLMPKSRVWKGNDPTDTELRDTVMAPATTAYSGTYVVDRQRDTVTHHVINSIDPHDEGKNLVRKCKSNGNQLELSGTWMHDGMELTFTVVWKRATG